MNTDNMQLTAIRRYAAGEDATAISRDMGMNDTWARVTVGRIRRADLADLAESGEDPATVRAAYGKGGEA